MRACCNPVLFFALRAFDPEAEVSFGQNRPGHLVPWIHFGIFNDLNEFFEVILGFVG